MKFCYRCGYQLSIGTEKFCPECGYLLGEANDIKENMHNDSKKYNGANTRDVSDTVEDLFEAKGSDSGKVIGVMMEYSLAGSTVHFHLSDKKLKSFFTKTLQKIIVAPILMFRIPYSSEICLQRSSQIESILEEIKRIEMKEGRQIHELRAENIRISKNELSLSEQFLIDNEHIAKAAQRDELSHGQEALLGKEEDILIFSDNFDFGYQRDDRYNSKELEQFQRALWFYDKAIGLAPNYAGAWNNKGFALDVAGRFEEAVKCYDKALELDPNYADAWNNKGRNLNYLKRYDEAVKCYDKALELDPNYADAWYSKGCLLTKLKKYKEAVKYYDKARELDPGLWGARDSQHFNLLELRRTGWFGWFRRLVGSV